jgi:RNA methyltransferase, TrmH family
MLTSIKNPRIHHIRKLQTNARTRKKESLFVVEGVRLVEEAFKTKWQPELVIYTADVGPRGEEILAGFRDQNIETVPVAAHVMQAASDTETPQGILAVIPMRSLEIPTPLTFVVIPDGVRDPGNLGTILRTALAAGVEAIFLPPESVDPYAPKVLRGGMGAHFRLPIIRMAWKDMGVRLTGMPLYLADSAEGQSIYKSDFVAPTSLIIGGEAAGAGDSAKQLATHRVHIPMPGQAESLNAAVAASIFMFEVVRQRQSPISPPPS